MKLEWTLQIIRALAENEARAAGFTEIELEHLIMGLCKFVDLPPRLLEVIAAPMGVPPAELPGARQVTDSLLLAKGLNSTQLRRTLRRLMGRGPLAGQSEQNLPMAAAARKILEYADQQAKNNRDGKCGAYYLLESACLKPSSKVLIQLFGSGRESTADDVTERVPQTMDLAELTDGLKRLRSELLEQVLGQDQAVQAFVEGLFNAEATAGADPRRQRPRGVFVFAGPPGVGKTMLAETGARILKKPFLRLDMSGYSDSMGVVQLAGAQRSYHGAKPGKLTSFVGENPDAFLLFDEIEKAGPEVIHLFLQILDHGSLEDRFNEQNVSFRDTLIVLTTNAGRSLYENGQALKIQHHRRTILSALELDRDPVSRKPFFPQAICSRLAAGYPVMFNRLGVSELVRIAAREIERIGELLHAVHRVKFSVDPLVPLCLVLREGAWADARNLRSQAESFCKGELFNLLRHMSREQIRNNLAEVSLIRFYLDEEQNEAIQEADVLPGEFLCPSARPRVLAVTGFELEKSLPGLPDLEIVSCRDIDSAKTMLASAEFDLVLLDPFLDRSHISGNEPAALTIDCFAKAPIGASSLRRGIEILRMIRELPEAPPVYLLAVVADGAETRTVDEELMISAGRYGAAGLLTLRAVITGHAFLEVLECSAEETEQFTRELREVISRVRREKAAAELAAQGKVLSFETSPAFFREKGELAVRLRRLRLVSAPSAADLGAVLSDAERPALRFSDVFGADQAKAELGYIVDWLKEPRKYSGLGLKPPRGLLLHGAPGTGKTMLARALAGESRVAFIVESATSFITKYQGSGPENVRSLFARGRRYAPSIVFIDEVDAIGRKREGSVFNRAQEETLNAVLTEMDGFTPSGNRPVIIIAATNLLEKLDPALVRRFDREVEVDKPDRAARKAFLAKRLAPGPYCKVSAELLDRIAGQSAGDTIANLERTIRLAGRMAARTDGIITDQLLDEALATMRLGDARESTPDRETLLRVARHEAGHCLVGWLQGEKPMQVSIMARGRVGGYVEREVIEEKTLYLKSELEQMIRQIMAGRAAEIVYYGREEGLSSGVSGDLRQAGRLAENMVCRFGMTDEPGQLFLEDLDFRQGALSVKVARAKEEIVSRQLKKAGEILAENRSLLDLLVQNLMEKNRLTREDLEELLA